MKALMENFYCFRTGTDLAAESSSLENAKETLMALSQYVSESALPGFPSLYKTALPTMRSKMGVLYFAIPIALQHHTYCRVDAILA